MVLLKKLGSKLIADSMIGLDIGNSIVKMVELRRSNGDVAVNDFMFEPYPEDTEGTKEEKAIQLIRKLVQENHVRTRRVVSVIPDKELIERFLYLPAGSSKKLTGIVKWEVTKHITFPIEEAVYDFSYSELPEEEKLCVYLVITKRSIVDSYIAMISGVGFEPFALESKAQALTRLLRWMKVTEGRKVAVLDIGSISSSFMIVENGVLRMTKFIEIGSEDITSTIVNLVHCTVKDAEDLKMSVGIKREVMESKDSSPTSVDYNVYSAIEFQMDRLIQEMKRALMFYFAQFEWENDPDILFLTGGASRIPNMDKFLANKLSMEVETIDPVSFMKCNDCEDKGPGTHLSIAFGLALRKN